MFLKTRARAATLCFFFVLAASNTGAASAQVSRIDRIDADDILELKYADLLQKNQDRLAAEILRQETHRWGYRATIDRHRLRNEITMVRIREAQDATRVLARRYRQVVEDARTQQRGWARVVFDGGFGWALRAALLDFNVDPVAVAGITAGVRSFLARDSPQQALHRMWYAALGAAVAEALGEGEGTDVDAETLSGHIKEALFERRDIAVLAANATSDFIEDATRPGRHATGAASPPRPPAHVRVEGVGDGGATLAAEAIGEGVDDYFGYVRHAAAHGVAALRRSDPWPGPIDVLDALAASRNFYQGYGQADIERRRQGAEELWVQEIEFQIVTLQGEVLVGVLDAEIDGYRAVLHDYERFLKKLEASRGGGFWRKLFRTVLTIGGNLACGPACGHLATAAFDITAALWDDRSLDEAVASASKRAFVEIASTVAATVVDYYLDGPYAEEGNHSVGGGDGDVYHPGRPMPAPAPPPSTPATSRREPFTQNSGEATPTPPSSLAAAGPSIEQNDAIHGGAFEARRRADEMARLELIDRPIQPTWDPVSLSVGAGGASAWRSGVRVVARKDALLRLYCLLSIVGSSTAAVTGDNGPPLAGQVVKDLKNADRMRRLPRPSTRTTRCK